jgi:hypothetical protein
MKLSRSDAAKTGENIKRDKRKRKEKIFSWSNLLK